MYANPIQYSPKIINLIYTGTFGMSMGSAGHYTQVIWDTSLYVGCGFQECPSSNGWMKNMFTCNYYPAMVSLVIEMDHIPKGHHVVIVHLI